MTRYNVNEHPNVISTGHFYTVNDRKEELSEQVYGHVWDAEELCNHLNKYEEEVNKYKFLYEENRQILAETENDRITYLHLAIKLAKKLGFKGPGEFHDAIREGYLDE